MYKLKFGLNIEQTPFCICSILFSDPNVLAQTLTGHTDGVWSLAYLGGNHQKLLSASADGTVKLWSPMSQAGTVNAGQQLVKTFGYTPIAGIYLMQDCRGNFQMKRLAIRYSSS